MNVTGHLDSFQGLGQMGGNLKFYGVVNMNQGGQKIAQQSQITEVYHNWKGLYNFAFFFIFPLFSLSLFLFALLLFPCQKMCEGCHVSTQPLPTPNTPLCSSSSFNEVVHHVIPYHVKCHVILIARSRTYFVYMRDIFTKYHGIGLKIEMFIQKLLQLIEHLQH